MTYPLSSKLKGIIRVSFSNVLSLAVSLITSFVLPIFISVEDYGYWQLFVLYAGYVGFFAFGFNDGVHLNYATNSYNSETASKFRTFKNLLLVISSFETVTLLFFLVVFFGPNYGKFYTLLFTILNIIPVLINGLFTYMNQATMRFKQYAWGNMLDKVVFAILMLILLSLGFKSYIYYVAAYTISRYLVIIYHFFSSHLVFSEKASTIKELKPEILHNFTSGFALMVATILNSSIIVGSRLLIENRFGIVEFGAFSFAFHTLVLASQFITAIASVFYPIMKRCNSNELENAYKVFDKASSLFVIVLLASYYFAAIIISIVYKKYVSILDYYMFVYPLFIFECKSNLLIINYYKVVEKPVSLVIRNAMGIGLHLAFVFLAYWLFKSVYSISIAVLVSYCIWYYFSQLIIYHEAQWKITASMCLDIVITLFFLLINLLIKAVYVGNTIPSLLIGLTIYILLFFLVTVFFKTQIRKTLQQTQLLLKD